MAEKSKAPQGPDSAAPRLAAAHLLDAVLGEGALMSEALAGPGLGKLAGEDRARAQRLATETLRHLTRTDKLLDPHLRKAPPLQARNIMRVATYELATGAAAHGVVNDVVTSLSRSRKTGHLKGLGNAVMRKVAEQAPREWDKMPVPSLPKWLRKPLVAAYGNRSVQLIEGAQAKGAPLDLTAKGDAVAVAEALGGTVLPTGSVRLPGQGQITALPGYADGAWWVQDAAAALPAKLLDVQPGEAVLDLCCAPGGKTMQLAAAGAKVTAVDDSEARMVRVAENLKRVGLEAELRVEDALAHQGSYDAILLDAPCSATGTMRRHPDLPHAKDGSEFAGLITLQTRMLARAVGLLKPGGRMVFCTCSLLPDEGECQIDTLLGLAPVMSVDRAPLSRDGIDPAWITEEGGLRLRPDYWSELGGMDGFYMAVLRKQG